MKKLSQSISVFLCTLLFCLFYINPANIKAESSAAATDFEHEYKQIESEAALRLHAADVPEIPRLMTTRSSSGIVPKPEYVITFNASYGTLNGNSSQTTVNQRLTSLPTAVRPGYTFRGWYTQSSGGTQITTNTTFSMNTNVYAQWDNYDANYRDFYISDIKDTSVAITTIIPNTYVRTWGISYGMSNVYLAESRVMNLYTSTTALTTTLTGLQPNTTYFFKVYYIADTTRIESGIGSFTTARANEYTISFYPNGGTVNGQSSVITSGQKLPYLPTAYRDGYNFDGWYTEAYNGTQINTNTVFQANGTVYAHWTATNSSVPSNPVVTPPSNGNTNNGTANGGTVNNGSSDSSNSYEDDYEPVSVKKIKLKSVTNSPVRKIKVRWNWYAYGDGYQIAYSTNKYFASNKTKRISAGVFTDAKTIAGLKKGKTYYVKVRAFQKSGGRKYYGAWSNVKKIKIKK